MSNRCPSCEKFVSLEAGDPEEQSTQIDGDDISVSVRVHLDCVDCSEEMKEITFDLSEPLPQEVIEHRTAHEEVGEEEEITVSYDSAEVNDLYRPRTPPKPRKDGTIPRVPFRFQTHYYIVTVTVDLGCTCGKTDFESVELTGEEAASAFDELN